MSDLIKTLSSKYDYILCDAPPINPVTDTMVLASLADGLIIITRVGVSRREAVETTLSNLGQMRSKVLGFILNGVKAKSTDEYSYESASLKEEQR